MEFREMYHSTELAFLRGLLRTLALDFDFANFLLLELLLTFLILVLLLLGENLLLSTSLFALYLTSL